MEPTLSKESIREIQPAEILQLRAQYSPRGINLGEASMNERAQALLDRISSQADKFFLLEWEGSKIPRWAKIHDVQIGWTQNGMVNGVKGEDLGTYERLVEFGGTSGKEQKIIVFAKAPNKRLE